MKRFNLLSTVSNPSMVTKVLGFIKEFAVIIGICLIAFLALHSFFSNDGLLAEMRKERAEMKALVEDTIEELRVIRKQQEEIKKEVDKTREEKRAALQRIGRFSRKEYHPTMKGVKGKNVVEQIEEIHRLNDKFMPNPH